MTHKPLMMMTLDVPKRGSRTEFVTIHPKLISAKWTKNHHLVADELTVTMGVEDTGVDPRVLRNARCVFFMWDDAKEDFEPNKHVRFTGICVKAHKKLEDAGSWVVEMTFHDYTTLFINNKPLKTTGLPYWQDTLKQVWERICDNTGWQDPDSKDKKIISSVAELKPGLVFARADFAARTVGDMVPLRFHAISRPQPKQGASSWDVWQWVVGSLGLVSYIDNDKCIVTDTNEHYKDYNAPILLYGGNIFSLEEEVDTTITNKGILLKSYNPLTGRVIEAFYPPAGDDRLKFRRAAVRKRSEAGATVTENEASKDYEEYNRYDITDQTALDRAAREAYEERSRQEVQITLKTAEMELNTRGGETIDILGLRAGDAISIAVANEEDALVLRIMDSTSARIGYLTRMGYDEGVATLIAENMGDEALADTTFHVKTLEVELEPDKFEVQIKAHNLIRVSN